MTFEEFRDRWWPERVGKEAAELWRPEYIDDGGRICLVATRPLENFEQDSKKLDLYAAFEALPGRVGSAEKVRAFMVAGFGYLDREWAQAGLAAHRRRETEWKRRRAGG